MTRSTFHARTLAALAVGALAVGALLAASPATVQPASAQDSASAQDTADATGPAGAAAPTPLFTHTDQGPVTVMHGASGERVPVGDAGAPVRQYVDKVNDLLGQGADAPASALTDAVERGRELQETDTQLTGTLYVEEAIRRLKRQRLDRVPVQSTQVHATYAQQYAERFAKRVVLRRGADDLGVSYATLAACLELAEIPNAKPPHKVRVEPDGTMWTRLGGTPLALDLVEFQADRMLLRSIVLGTSRSLGFKDKAQVARMLLDTCV